MFPFGFFITAFGMFLVDCAVKNRAPITLLEAVVSDPKNLRGILSQTSGTGYVSDVPANGVSGSAALPGLLNPSGVLGPSATASAALAWAAAQIGKPYKWGAAGPNAFDCSGLTSQAYYHAGVTIPRTTGGQILVGTKVAKKDLQPGDLVFPTFHHVQLYAGNGTVIEAPRTGENVRHVQMWGFFTARRVVSDSPKKHDPTPPAHHQHGGTPDFGGSAGLQDIFGGKP